MSVISLVIPALATFIALCSAYVLWEFVLLPRKNPLRRLPGPPSSTKLLTLILNAERSAQAHEALLVKYGRNIHFTGIASWDDRLLSFDPAVITYILSNPSKYQKAWQSRRVITRMIGCGMLAAEGIVHKRQRKVSTPAFSSHNLKGFIPTFFSKAEELCKKWESILDVSQSRLDVCHWISRATFDVIGAAGFDYEFNAIEEESNEVYLAYKDMFEIAISQNQSIKSILAIYFPIIWKLFPDESTRVVDKSWEIILRIGRQLVRNKKLAIDQGQDGKDLLSLLLKSNASTEIPLEQRISDDDILFQISTFLFAGSDTTSLALTWTLFLLSLSQHLDLQRQLREELRQIDPLSAESVQFSDLDALPFLDRVIKESLRLIPPVHSSLRVATERDVIPTSQPVSMKDGTISSGIPVAAGSMIHIPVEAFALDRTIWGPDAWEFKPDRWLDLPAAVKEQPGLYSNLLCFSAGPRSCIGMRFSIMEMKILLYKLVSRFTFSDPEDIFKANVVLTRPYLKGRYQQGSQCPIVVTKISNEPRTH